MDEGSVYFQQADGKVAQVVECGVAGAEIIHREFHTHFTKTIQGRVYPVIIAHEQRLGDFQHQAVRGKARLFR